MQAAPVSPIRIMDVAPHNALRTALAVVTIALTGIQSLKHGQLVDHTLVLLEVYSPAPRISRSLTMLMKMTHRLHG